MARPRVATNQRAMAVCWIWLNMPCPQNRNRNTAMPSVQIVCPSAISTAAPAKAMATIGASRDNATVSAHPPRPKSSAAELSVAAV